MKRSNWTEWFMDTAQALADNDMDVTRTANAMFLHRNGLLYRLNVIQRNTGKNLLCFKDLCAVLGYKKEGENVSSDSNGQSV